MHLPASIRRALGAGLAAAALSAAVAQAHTTRYAAPGASPSAACTESDPCRIDVAVNGSSDGDVVVVKTGTYGPIIVPLDAPDIDLHGEAGHPAPVLQGDTNLAGDLLTLSRGGTVRHLVLVADSPAKDALHLDEGVAEDLEIRAITGDAAQVATSADTTVLRDSVVESGVGGSSGNALLLVEGSGSSPSLAIRNVSVFSATDVAIRCSVGLGHQATIGNAIARGASADLAAPGGTGCSATNSNVRPAMSTTAALGAGMQSAEPLLDAARRPQPGSPTIDAGGADPWTTAADPFGTARAVPDIGAYEFVAGTDDEDDQGEDDQGEDEGDRSAPTPTPPVESVEPPVHGVPAPMLGETVVVAPGQGKVLVRRPGARRFRKLAGAALLPSGTVVDARRGRIRLTTALDEAGRFQTGRFWGSRFQIRQSASGNGMTSLALRGGDFGRCPARVSALAHTSAVPRENPTTRRVVRRLWSRDRGGRFRTYGNNSVATARGTAWVTKDRCDGTVTRVRDGAVAVKDRRTGRTVIVRAGGAYLAKR